MLRLALAPLVVGCGGASITTPEAPRPLRWQCAAVGSPAVVSDRPSLASVLAPFAGANRFRDGAKVATALLEAGYWEPAVGLLEAARGDGDSALLDLLYGRALTRRALATCSVLDALRAAAELKAAARDPALVARALDERGRLLELLGVGRPPTGASPRQQGRGTSPVIDRPAELERAFRAALDEASGARVGKGTASRLVDQSPWLAARALEQIGWPAWAASHRDRREPEAPRQLELFGAIATALSERGFDRQPLASWREISATVKNADPAETRRLEEALIELGRGIDAYEQQRFETAGPALERARSLLDGLGSSLALWARFYQAIGRYYDDAERGVQEFRAIAEMAEQRGFSGLAGRARWLEGSALLLREDFAGSITSHRRAREQLRAAGGEGAAAFIDVLEAEATSLAGDAAAAWRLRFRAFSEVPGAESLRRQIAMLWEAATALDLQGRPDLREPLLDRAVDLSEIWGEPLGVSTARLERAHWRIEQRDAPAAERDIRIAESRIALMEPGTLKQESEGDVAIQRGLLAGLSDPLRGAQILASVADRQRKVGNLIALLDILPRRAELLLRGGQVSEAREDLRAAIQLYEKARATVSAAIERDSLLRRARESLDLLVESEFQDGAAGPLVAEIDRLRARSIGEARVPSELPTRPSGVVVPPGGAVLFAHSTSREVFFWLFGDGTGARSVRVPAPLVQGLVADFRALLALGASEAELRRPLSRLHDLILAGLVGEALPDPMVFVPDSGSNGIPLAALFDERRGRYLIEETRLTTYPTLSALEEDVRRPRTRPSALKAVVVGVDAAQADRESALPRLVFAAREAEAVGRMLPGALVLSGASASRVRIEQAIREGASVFHFAGHAIGSSFEPAASYLELAGGERWNPGRGGEIDLSHLDLVVLSGCSTLDPLATDDSAVFGLAGSFYAAGARAVIGTGVPVRDRDAAALAPLFYASGSAADAVAGYRAAILRARAAGGELGSPAVWGAWRVFGGLSGGETSGLVRPRRERAHPE